MRTESDIKCFLAMLAFGKEVKLLARECKEGLGKLKNRLC